MLIFFSLFLIKSYTVLLNFLLLCHNRLHLCLLFTKLSIYGDIFMLFLVREILFWQKLVFKVPLILKICLYYIK